MIGTKVAHFTITAHLGSGGMGEVYQATDSKLGRSVAIKLLPAAFASDPERLSRFRREAQLLASLNHPNIAHIYGLEESDETRCIVMELVEGETLQARIKKGPIPVDESLTIAKQIAEALEAAHEKGVVHRDLKPGNVMLTADGKVKVLDFGLAKAYETNPSNPSMSNSPTMASMGATNAGVILGTAAYMSPEQAKGRTVDKRTDVFAFGAVLYEMLTGRPVFDGEDVADILSRVLQREPDWALLPANVPGRIRELLRLCLEKNAKNRRSDATDVRLDIEQAFSEPALPATVVTPARKTRERIAWGIAAVALIAVGALLAADYFVPAPASPVITRFLMELPPEARLGTVTSSPFPSISPDGRYIVFTAVSDGVLRLWIRPVDSVSAQPIAGTGGVTPPNSNPFWSADSRFIGFFAGGKLKKVAVGGGPPQILCDANGDAIDGAWNQDDVILFENDGSLHRVAAGGGVSSPVRTPDNSKGDSGYKFPSFLPDGRHFVYVALSSEPGRSGVRVGALDSDDDKPLFATYSRVVYAHPDHLFFVRDGTLMAQPFDVQSLSLTGEVFPVAEQVVSSSNGTAAFGVSSNGTLVYRAGGAAAATELTWFDRSGKNLGVVRGSGVFSNPRLSPDQNHLAVEKRDGGSGDIWQIDLLRGTHSRFSLDAGDDKYPVYSPDGKQIAFGSNRAGTAGLYVKPATGGGSEELIQRVGGSDASPADWSPDGKVLLYNFVAPSTARDIWALSMTGERKASPVLNQRFNEQRNNLSADGHWLAYMSDETGRNEIYVQAFPPSGGKWQVSVDGGTAAYWRRDGKEIIFDSPDGKIMAADVKLGATFEAGVPRELFQLPSPNAGNRFVVTADAQRFLFALAPQSGDRPTLTVVLNWMADIKK